MSKPWEDSFFERKSSNDFDDICRTLVAFANTLNDGQTAKLVIGELDDGTVQGIDNVDTYQQKVKKKIGLIYPPILYRVEHRTKDGRDLIEIVVESSVDKPHFERPAWIRKGNVTEKASPAIFQSLIEQRLSKVFLLEKWVGKQVSVCGDEASVQWGIGAGVTHAMYWTDYAYSTLVEVNPFWMTVENQNNQRRSQPLERVVLNFNNQKNQIELLMQFS